jgi:thiol-disulfide isomerase/thioredoxin
MQYIVIIAFALISSFYFNAIALYYPTVSMSFSPERLYNIKSGSWFVFSSRFFKMAKIKKIAARLTLAVFALVSLYWVAVGLSHGHSDVVPYAHAAEKSKLLMAPPFSLPNTDGKMISLADYKGKWVFVNFWATWCGPCVMEMPMLAKLHSVMKGKKFEMLAINMEEIEPDQVKKFIRDNKISFTVLLDKDSKTGRNYAVESLPTTYVVSPAGEIYTRAVGMREWDSEEVVSYFKDLVSGKTPKQG